MIFRLVRAMASVGLLRAPSLSRAASQRRFLSAVAAPLTHHVQHPPAHTTSSSDAVSPHLPGFEPATSVKTGGSTRPLYLDLQATTPMDPRVVDAMLPYMTTYFGNPHSRTHAYGWESEKGVETAREQVAALIKADPKEVLFTSGATESNNIAIKGVARFYKKKKNHVITTQTVGIVFLTTEL